MSALRTHATRLLPSLTDVAFVLPALFLFGRMDGARSLLGDGDTGWHIRTGEWILAHGRVPDHDLFSFTRSGQPWFAWEWLWDAIFAALHQQAGMAGVVLGSVLVLSVTFALLFRLAARKCGNPLVAIAVTAVAAAASSFHWLARPHLFTLLFTAVFLSILDRAQEKFHTDPARRRLLLAALPVLTVLWTNLHGGFFVGIVLVGGYAAGELAAAFLRVAEARAALARARSYLLVAAGCLAASLLNPYTFHLHRHIWTYLFDGYLRQNNNEFLSLNFQRPDAIYFELLLLGTGAVLLWSLPRKRIAETILLVLWAHLALVSARNIAIFAIVAAPTFARTVQEWIEHMRRKAALPWVAAALAKWESLSRETGAIEGLPRVHAASAGAALLLTGLLFARVPVPVFRAEYNPQFYPAAAITRLAGLDSLSRIFTHDEWGDYLIYRLYPHTRVFVDGRSDFYGSGFIREYLDILRVRSNWENRLEQFGVNTVMMPPGAALAGVLKQSPRWHVTYDDGIALIFQADQPVRDQGQQISAASRAGEKIVIARSRDLQQRDRVITGHNHQQSTN